MTFLIFVIILGVLVIVHELGHFLAAKRAGVQVEEFGFGYPPRAISLGRKWGTLFSINWIPFGGFVKIFGENYENEVESEKVQGESKKGKKFTGVSKKWQALILVAGVTFNILFAWFLFSLSFMIGVPTPVENTFGGEVKDPSLTIVGLLPDSPAVEAGLKTGDKIKNIYSENGDSLKNLNPESVSDFINNSSGGIKVEVLRGKKDLNFNIVPETGIIKDRKIVGIDMDIVGILSLPIHKAILEGGRATLSITYLTAAGLINLIKDSIMGQADLSEVTGPVGIVGLVGDASRLGLSYLLTFTALISINLAIVNLLPFPALDGGRLLFVAIEAVTRKPINPKIAGWVNGIGFAILLTLMLIVTYRDIAKLF